MEIKLLAFLSLFPIIPTILKIYKRNNLTCIDIILLYQTLYMCIIPIIFDHKNITYPDVRNRSDVHLYIFYIYNAFAYLLLLIDQILIHKYPKSNSIYFFTKYINKWSRDHILSTKILYLIVLIEIVQWYIVLSSFSESQAIGIGSMDYYREMKKMRQTPFTIWIENGSDILRLYVIFILTVFYIQYKQTLISLRKKWVFIVICIIELLYHLQISRTYLLESISLVALIVYATNKSTFTLKSVLKISCALVVVIMIGFPILSGIRAAKRVMIASNISVENIYDLLKTNSDILFSDIDFSESDNKDDRVWNVYQIIGYSYLVQYKGQGELTYNAISIGLPKLLFPNKSELGSQGIIEKKTGINDDIADSMLLLGVMENRLIGFFYSAIYYMLVILFFDVFLKLLKKIFKNDLCIPIVIVYTFVWLNRVEFSFDGFIPTYINLILWYPVFYILLRIVKKIQLPVI